MAEKKSGSKSSSKSEKDPVAAAEAGNEQVQEAKDQEDEQGFRGTEVDPTPNEAYTLQGVTEGQPTPETDPEAAREAGSTRFAGGTGASAND